MRKPTKAEIDAAITERARKTGAEGGRTRAAGMTAAQRSEAARLAARALWTKRRKASQSTGGEK